MILGIAFSLMLVLLLAAGLHILGQRYSTRNSSTDTNTTHNPSSKTRGSKQAATPSPEAQKPKTSPGSSTSPTVTGKESLDQVKAMLASLAVRGKAADTGYSREQFGPAWADVDSNGCDTRNDILIRDLEHLQFKSGRGACVVASGQLNDPYTGKLIHFVRGPETSGVVQIDHLVSLHNAWLTGAQQLSVEQRMQLANDPLNLLAVDGPANQNKRDRDASAWLPPNTAFRCTYAARQVQVKTRYQLWLTPAEKQALTRILTSC